MIQPATLITHANHIVTILLRPAFLDTGDRRVGQAIRELLTMQGELAADEAEEIVSALT